MLKILYARRSYPKNRAARALSMEMFLIRMEKKVFSPEARFFLRAIFNFFLHAEEKVQKHCYPGFGIMITDSQGYRFVA